VRCVGLICDRGIDAALVAAAEAALDRVLGLPSRRCGEFAAARAAYDPHRQQYDSSALLIDLAARAPRDCSWVLAITEHDLYVPMLSFVFGQAQLGGRMAIVSLARLRQEFYGLPPDPELLRRRAVKEVLHEMGHGLGLVHCVEPLCALSLSTDLLQVDSKQPELCDSCRALLRETIRARRENAPADPE
jgi:archaemetzincin